MMDKEKEEAFASECERLEMLLKSEIDKYSSLRLVIDKDSKDKGDLEMSMLNSRREAKFFKDKVSQIDRDLLDRQLNELKVKAQELAVRRERLEGLKKKLEVFGDVEATDEALKRKIDELKKSRLSLEMSFVDES